jgi:hypothetical protein
MSLKDCKPRRWRSPEENRSENWMQETDRDPGFGAQFPGSCPGYWIQSRILDPVPHPESRPVSWIPPVLWIVFSVLLGYGRATVNFLRNLHHS